MGLSWLPDLSAAFQLHFVAALLFPTWYRHPGYMFSDHAVVDGVMLLSDSALIAKALVPEQSSRTSASSQENRCSATIFMIRKETGGFSPSTDGRPVTAA